jgi:LPXTG-motif cell wall-anchored protein
MQPVGLLRRAVATGTVLAGVLGVVDNAAASGPAEVHVPTTIDATGSRNVTGELQRVLDQAPDGSTIVFPAGAVYRVDGTLVLRNRSDITIEGNGATFRAVERGGTHRAHWKAYRGSNIVFRNLVIDGANPHAGRDDRAYQATMMGQHGIRISGTHGVEIDRVTITDVYADFVYLGLSGDEPNATFSEDVWIHDSTFMRNGRQGIALTAARDVIIEDNYFAETRRATLDIEPNGPAWGVQNVHILNNRVGPGRLLFVAGEGWGPVSDVVIAGNQLEGHVLNASIGAINRERRPNVWFVDNTSDVRTNGTTLWFKNIDGLTVTGNRQAMSGRGPAVNASNSCGVVAHGNDFGSAPVINANASRRCNDVPALAVTARPVEPDIRTPDAAAPAPAGELHAKVDKLASAVVAVVPGPDNGMTAAITLAAAGAAVAAGTGILAKRRRKN